jgi:phosphopantothenoylcysteine decarboxylase / phosphopantothenate---cysteine ligase
LKKLVRTIQVDFQGKTIAIAISGGIAAYKACDLIRELYRRGAGSVRVLMSENAQRFVSPLTFQALSRYPVVVNELDVEADGTPTHIQLAQQCDALLVMPATANCLAKLAHGLADDVISTTFLTFHNKPVVIAPAMNTRMWQHTVTQRNLEILKTIPALSFVPVSSGLLACGETGEGHLASIETILQYLYRTIHPEAKRYDGMDVIVTTGGTREAIDPVRIITNHSSGKMGLAIADELFAMGANVTLITTGSIWDRPYTQVVTPSVTEMKQCLEERFPRCDMLVMTAAVSDFQVANPSETKIKKQSESLYALHLTQAPDILAGLGAIKHPHQVLVGFAAESHDLVNYAQDKLARKNLDAIVANDISRKDIGFNSDENEVTLFFPNHQPFRLEKQPKDRIAQAVLKAVHQVCWQARPASSPPLEPEFLETSSSSLSSSIIPSWFLHA